MRDSARDSIIQWSAITLTIIVGVAGVGLPWADYGAHPKLADLLTNVGYGLLGGGFTALIFQLTIGKITADSAQKLESRIEQIPEIIRRDVSELQVAISTARGITTQANVLGIAALGTDRDDSVFEREQSMVERWKDLVRNASHVDLLCYEDSKMLSAAAVGPLLRERSVQDRLQRGELHLRLLVSAPDNPILSVIGTWYKPDPDHFRTEALSFARTARLLDELDSSIRSKIVRQHRNEVLPFTLLRGDERMYVMYFIPNSDGGPVVEIKPKGYLYGLYLAYFEDLWGDPTRERIVRNPA